MRKSIDKNKAAHFANDFALYGQIGYTEAMEMRIFLGIVSQVDPYDETAPMEGILSFGQMQQLAREPDTKRSGSLTKDIEKTVKKMMGKNYVMFSSPIMYKGTYLNKYRVIFDRLNPEKIDGTLFYKWRLHEDMRPHVKNLLNNFVRISLPRFMRSSHSIRFLIMATAHHNRLRRHKKRTNMCLTIKELKRVLNLEDKYPRIDNFRVRVIEHIVKEVNASGLLIISDYNYVKQGRTITHIDFYFQDGDLVKQSKVLPSPKQTELDFTAPESPKTPVNNNSNFVPTESNIAKLTRAQLTAYYYLIERKCIPGIVYRRILPNVPSSEFRGWEDIYIKNAWERFETITKYKQAKRKAGAFVKWWEKGEFKDRLFSEMMEKVIATKKSKTPEQYANRQVARDMTADQFRVWYEQQQETKIQAEHESKDNVKKEGAQNVGDVMKNQFRKKK